MDKRLPTRFWAKVQIDQRTECWNWTASLDGKGYGKFWLSGIKLLRGAHQVAYVALVGFIPEEYELDHLCRNRKCCNPEHLEAVTHRENSRRADWSSNTGNPLGGKCRKGHELTPENTWGRKRPQCKVCSQLRMKKFRDRQGPSAPQGPKTHCRKGHEFTPENVYTAGSSGKRTCRTCSLSRMKRYREEKRKE